MMRIGAMDWYCIQCIPHIHINFISHIWKLTEKRCLNRGIKSNKQIKIDAAKIMVRWLVHNQSICTMCMIQPLDFFSLDLTERLLFCLGKISGENWTVIAIQYKMQEWMISVEIFAGWRSLFFQNNPFSFKMKNSNFIRRKIDKCLTLEIAL